MRDQKVPPRAASYDKKVALGCVTTMDIVELIYRPPDPQGHSKDYEFSRTTMRTRWAQGLADAQTTLLASPWLTPMPPEVGARTFDVLKDVPLNGAPGTVETMGLNESVALWRSKCLVDQ
jgi:NTE family protein